MALDFAAELNEEQLVAVNHGDGPQLVIAGAGSGKTRVITFRIAWLVQERGIDPSQIAAVTFTNKAAAEMRERIEELLGLHPLPAFVGTFHRFALRLLRMYGQKVDLPRDFSILDSSDQQTLVKRAMKDAGVPDDAFRPPAVLGAISAAKNQLIGPARYEQTADDFFSRKVSAVYRHYQSLLREAGGVDFDDMIRLSVKLLAQNDGIRRRVQARHRYLLVDEFQDTNHAQLRLIEEVCGPETRLTAVGDEDQSIYRWRGAEIENILEFERTFSGAAVRKLERNYRSTQTILDASGGLVSHNEKRRGKTLWTDSGDGEKVLLFRGRDEQDEAKWVSNTFSSLHAKMPWGQMAVLVRTNAQSRALEDAFLRRGVPYTLVAGVRFYERAEIKDLVAYLRLLRNPRDTLSFDRVLNRPTRGIGKTTQNQLRRLAAERSTHPWDVLQNDELLSASFAARASRALRGFRDLVDNLRAEGENLPLPALLERILSATGFLKQYDEDNADDRARIENVREMLSAAQEFVEQNAYQGQSEDLLSSFLDHVSLTSDTDSLGGDGVSLMTLHSAKGLEFDAVVVAGLEEGLLPHFNSQAHGDDLEEERRLLYVGMTRARRRLFLTACRRRRVAGTYQDQDESRFLGEIPERTLEVENSPELFSSPGGYGGGYSQSRRGGGSGGRGSAWGRDSGRGPRDKAASDVLSFFGQKAPEDESQEPFEAPGGPAPNLRLPFAQDPDRSGGRLKKGARVRHAKLGTGKVLQIEGKGDSAKLIVYFDGVGRRKLIAKYANLDVL